jgi:hypothetical protein
MDNLRRELSAAFMAKWRAQFPILGADKDEPSINNRCSSADTSDHYNAGNIPRYPQMAHLPERDPQ